jgi:hypothetical protein
MHSFCQSSIMLLLVSLITYCLLYNYRTVSSNSSKYVERIVRADIHSSDFEGKSISDGSNMEEKPRDTSYKMSSMQPRFGYGTENTGRC